MEIDLTECGKRFRNEWVFRKLNQHFQCGSKTAITGYNGSGKSTLLGVISGRIRTSEGKVQYKNQGNQIEAEDVYRYLSITAPDVEPPLELSLFEVFNFNFSVKPILADVTFENFLEIIKLQEHQSKCLNELSSGMRQRFKLGLTLLADVPLKLLDEPTSNLDDEGKIWYQDLIGEFAGDSTLIVCTNNFNSEAAFCTQKLDIAQFKPMKNSRV